VFPTLMSELLLVSQNSLVNAYQAPDQSFHSHKTASQYAWISPKFTPVALSLLHIALRHAAVYAGAAVIGRHV
jgi:hypothetical protein